MGDPCSSTLVMDYTLNDLESKQLIYHGDFAAHVAFYDGRLHNNLLMLLALLQTRITRMAGIYVCSQPTIL